MTNWKSLKVLLKGFSLNTNDQAVVSTSLCSAICFFYILKERNFKIRFIGYMLLMLLGVVVFVSASRAALLGYILTFLFTFFLHAGPLMRLGYLSLISFFAIFIFNLFCGRCGNRTHVSTVNISLANCHTLYVVAHYLLC